MFISPPAISQFAAMAAFDCYDELDLRVTAYSENRELLTKFLIKAGFKGLAPSDGAFYIYADASNFTNNSEEFCKEMLRATGVAATPGIDFDPIRGNSFVRFSFSGSADIIEKAGVQLVNWLNKS